MAMSLATKFAPYTDEQFSTESKISLVTNNDFGWTGAHTVKVYKVSTSKMNDYGRTGATAGNWSRYGAVNDLNTVTEEFALRKDRSFIFNIDKLDQDETAEQLQAATALARQNRQEVIPEVDMYTYAEMAKSAGTVVSSALTADNIYDAICEASRIMDEAEVPETGRVLIVTPATYRIMKSSKEIVMNSDIGSDMRIRGVVSNLDGMNVQKIPANRLPAGLGFMIAHPDATIAPKKLEDFDVNDGGIYSSGNVVTGRVVYDAFVLDNKRKALYVHYTTANGLTVTSAAGATGKTAVTVSPALISGNSYVYKTAASVDMPLTGDDLSSWTVWNGTVEISATAGNTIVIAEVDSAKKCVKAGKAVVVSG